ncbi:transient receptor potential cation channel protein painless-like [Chironomus tepperi]|uniref:transient receptor potential cation channel protein painless-like n=1 Tax=Chironomus tepperi TaxID=113505 RepID=UPI00391F0F5C
MNKTQHEKILTQLIKSFEEKNVKEFVFYFEKYSLCSDVSLKSIGIDLTITEYILQTPDSSIFIDICLDYSTSLYKKNPNGRYMLYYVVQSTSSANVEVFLKHLAFHQASNISINKSVNDLILKCETKNENNCLHDVIYKLTRSNYKECAKIIEMLLSFGVNPNHLNHESKSPFEILLEKLDGDFPQQEVIQAFGNATLEISDSSNYRAKISTFNTLNIKYRNKNNYSSDYLLELVKRGNENEFIAALQNTGTEEMAKCFCELMKSSIKMNFAKGVVVMLELAKQTKANEYIGHEMQSLIPEDITNVMIGDKTPLFHALSLCQFEVVAELLKFKSISFKNGSKCWNVLHEICSLQEVESNDDLLKCFELILKDERCDDYIINAFDSNNKTPLMYACENHHKDLECELIRRDAYVGHEAIIKNLNENIFIEQLNESMVPSADLNDHECKVQINYKFLIPPKFSENRNQEMKALFLIASESRLKNVLTHPVLTSFLELKWKRVNMLMYGTLFIYFLFFVYLTLFILNFFNDSLYNPSSNRVNIDSRFGDDEPLRNFEIVKILLGRSKRDVQEEEEEAKHAEMVINMTEYIKSHKLTYALSLIGTLVLTVCEIVQLIYTWRQYFFKLSNWVDCALLFLAYIVLLRSFGSIETLLQLRAVLFLLIAIQSFIIIARVSKLSLQLEIFKKVSKTFLKFIMLYFMLIFAFAMAFYTLYGSQKSEVDKDILRSDIDNTVTENGDDDNSFTDILMSTITVIRMMLSDFEGVKLQPDNQFNSFIFLTFVLLITIVLFNLLNALAINDTQEMMKFAEAVDVQKRIRMITTCEKVLQFMGIEFFNIYSNQFKCGRIFLTINKDNYVRIKKKVDVDGRMVFKYCEVSKMQIDQHNDTKDIELMPLESEQDYRANKSSYISQIYSLMPPVVLQYLAKFKLKLSSTTVEKIVEYLKELEKNADK